MAAAEMTPEAEAWWEKWAREIGPRFLVAMAKDGVPITPRVARAADEHRCSGVCPCRLRLVRPTGDGGGRQ